MDVINNVKISAVLGEQLLANTTCTMPGFVEHAVGSVVSVSDS